MTFGINYKAAPEDIALVGIWEPKAGESTEWCVTLLDVRRVEGDGGYTLYGKLVNSTGNVLHKVDKATKYARKNDYQGRVSFSAPKEGGHLLQRALYNLMSVIDFSSPICLTIALSTNGHAKTFADKVYESPVPGQPPLALDDAALLAFALKVGALSYSPYTGESLFEESELVSRKGDEKSGSGTKFKSPREAMEDRLVLVNHLNKTLNPGIDLMDALLNDAFYRLASIVVR
jgi:hypothetical protein